MAWESQARQEADITEPEAERASFREVLAVKEFRALWIAHAQSRAGDQLARVAVAILVFDRTSSTLLTALTYALTFLPPLLSAPLLSGLADRWPRRTILVAVDSTRALLVALMAVPQVPLAVLGGLLICSVSLQPLYSAARNAALPNVLSGDKYVVGMGIVTTTDSIVQVAGFALGGVLVGLAGPHVALGVNAVTFLLSVTIVRLGVGEHRPAVAPDDEAGGWSVTRGAQLIFRDPKLRSLVGLIWLYGFYIAPEGIAAPYAQQLHAGSYAVGLLMAADPIGAGIGAYVLTRWVRPDLRPRLIGGLAALAGVPLVLSALIPALPVAVGMWALSGVLSSHVMLAIAEFTRAVPDHQRGQAIGLASAGLATAQGLGVLLAGSLAEWLSPSLTVALCGAAGTACAVWCGLAWRRASAGPGTLSQ
ncbi:MFS transporter [Flindersiella endophytica]